jgi:hypothetical protein
MKSGQFHAPGEEASDTPWTGGWVGPQSQSGRYWEGGRRSSVRRVIVYNPKYEQGPTQSYFFFFIWTVRL